MKHGVISGAMMLLAGCSNMAGDAEDALREQMFDSESAKFENVRVLDREAGPVVCGEVNGKNRMGGYVGFQPFIAIESDDGEVLPMVIDEDAPSAARELHQRVCESDE